MGARVLPLLVALCLVGLPAVGAPPSVLQPNVTAYTSGEVTALLASLGTLAQALRDGDLGSHRFFAPSQWMSRDFAAYTAGVLGSRGYATRLVSAAGWPDGIHTWLVVGIRLGSKTAWVPVEASPASGHSQEVLGAIPSRTDSAGQVWFDVRYVTIAEEVILPPNVPPRVEIRSVPSSPTVGQAITFLGTACIDPDGEIVRYVWTLGDGSSFAARNVQHVFAAAGTYTVSLSVTDSRGASATTALAFVVGGSSGTPSAPRSSCHCSGG